MKRALVWVVGEGGLLGSQVGQLLAREVPEAVAWRRRDRRLPWDQPTLVQRELDREAEAFFRTVGEEFETWAILWCAGAGVIQTPDAALERESLTFERFLVDLGRHVCAARRRIPGLVALASSAGTVYAENIDTPLSEDTPCQPTSGYGRQKLRQENALRIWADTVPEVGWLIGRFSTLYGPGQNLEKPQGFISQLISALLFHRAMHVYVPLDTQRDFLHSADAASHLLRCVAHLLTTKVPGRAIKIFASGRSVSLAEVVALLSRIFRQPVRIVGLSGRPQGIHPGKLRFRSTMLPHVSLSPARSLMVGMSQVYRHQLMCLRQGILPAPRLT
jgi:UDP-glucose 4-epimerase